MLARTITVLLPGILAAPGALHAQYTQQVQNQMTQYSAQFVNRGYSSVTQLVTGSLAASSNTSHSVPLNAGRSYAIVGVCDNDCHDVDLRLFAPDGSNIAQDVALDDHPTLQFTAPVSGQYRLQVEMVTCGHNPCYYGVQVFGGGSGTPMNQPMPMNQPTPMNQPMPMNQPQPMMTGAQLPMLGMIAANQQVVGNLAMQAAFYNAKPIQTWGFNCNAGQTIQVDILSTWDNYLVIFDPLGSSVGTNDDGGEGTNARLTYTCLVTGTYKLGITVYSTNTTPGAYTLQVQSAVGNQMQMNQPTSLNRPTQLQIGAPQPIGTIGANQQVMGNLAMQAGSFNGKAMQTWGFACAAGQTFQMDITSSWDNYAIIFDPAGTNVAHDDDAGGNNNARVLYTCAVNGTYRLGVTTYSTTTTAGAYTLQVQSAWAGGVVAVNQTSTQPVLQAALPLAGASGATLPQSASTGIEVTGTIAAPNEIAFINVGESRRGRLETGDRRMNDGTWADVWQFQGRQGQRVRIECRSEEFDTYLQLLDAQNARLAEDDDSLGDQNSLIEITLPATGNYTIVVNNFGEDRRAGIYTLTLH
jgi:hypothetical protein